MVPRTGRLVLPAASRERLSCSQMVMSGGLHPDHPRTAGPWVSPSRSPRPQASNQRLVKGEMPGSPLTGISSRGSIRNLCTRRLEDQTTGASQWTLRGCPSSPPGQCKSPQARIQQPYVEPLQAPNSLIRVQSSGSCPVMEMKNRYYT